MYYLLPRSRESKDLKKNFLKKNFLHLEWPQFKKRYVTLDNLRQDNIYDYWEVWDLIDFLSRMDFLISKEIVFFMDELDIHLYKKKYLCMNSIQILLNGSN